MHKNDFDLLVIGGGAAGYFAAINAAEFNSNLRIVILERSNKLLSKVKISGGGRCNVTHAEFDPMELVKNYPRGGKELLGPFHRFMTGDTMVWFEERGIKLKIEEDGRVFPVSNDSRTIIDCFESEARKLGITVLKKQPVIQFSQRASGWKVSTNTNEFTSKKLLIATGSNSKIWEMIQETGHAIVPPVPSLFTFNIRDKRINDLPGVAKEALVRILDSNGQSIIEDYGPILITHWGLSGPAILKLSAWGARLLNKMNYHFTIEVNWLEHKVLDKVTNELKSQKDSSGKKTVRRDVGYNLPKRLWQNLVEAAGILPNENWGDLSKIQMNNLASQLTESRFAVKGKSTFKEEFVTAGGIRLSEVHFKNFESKLHPNLYFAGEVLDIDAITGGFNFQSAWTSAYLAAKSIAGV